MATEVISIHSVDEWKNQLAQAKQHSKLVVAKFTASWCGPCSFIAPLFAELAKTKSHIIFLKVDVDEMPSVTQEYEVTSMPTFVFIKDEKVIDRIKGADRGDLQKKVELHGESPSVSA